MSESGISVRGHRVLLRMREVETTSQGGIYIPEQAREREELANTHGEVVSVGLDSWEGETPWAVVGDWVLIAKYSGVYVKGKDNRVYRVVNDRDIVGVLDEDFFPTIDHLL